MLPVMLTPWLAVHLFRMQSLTDMHVGLPFARDKVPDFAYQFLLDFELPKPVFRAYGQLEVY